MCDPSALIGPGELDWYTDSFILELIKKSEGSDKIEIISHTLEPLTGKGENFLSTLYRAKVTYKINGSAEVHRPIVIKASLAGSIVDELTSELDIFEREGIAFNTIIPECEKLFKSINDEIHFGPKVYSVAKTLFAMEDLDARGYGTEDRKDRLDFEMCKEALHKLAKFHAATAVLNLTQPELFTNHLKGNLTEAETPYHEFYRNAVETCVKSAKRSPELEPFIENFTNFQTNIIDRQIKVFTRDDAEFKCLNHGDMWTNNIMLKKSESGRVEDVILIDFQEGYFGSPAIDLNFLLYTSVQDDVQINHLDEVIEFYHHHLAESLTNLGYTSKVPTLQDIKDAIRRKFDHALTGTFCVLPLYLNENPEVAGSIHFLTDGDEALAARDEVFSNPKYQNVLKRLLPKFVQENLL